jgi:hypothetical protein
VYIREAHPTDGWQVPANERGGFLAALAKTEAEKHDNATLCVRKLNLGFPVLVDNMDHKVELEYAGWPDRLYLIGRDGRILFKGAPGPQGFRPAELEAAIQGMGK